MSNEELVVAIQAGEDRMGELWEQVQRFIVKKARHVMTALEGRGDVELDDLIQSGYLALADAVAAYKPEQGAFLTVLGYHLKSQFAVATRFRSARQQRETLAGTVELDRPVGDKSKSATLGDLQEDPAGAAALEEVEERIYQEQLHEALETSLAEIPAEQADVLRQRYFQGKSLGEIAELNGCWPQLIHDWEGKGLRAMRKPAQAKRLRSFMYFDAYSGTGLSTFMNTGMSVQERYLIRQEEKGACLPPKVGE